MKKSYGMSAFPVKPLRYTRAVFGYLAKTTHKTRRTNRRRHAGRKGVIRRVFRWQTTLQQQILRLCRRFDNNDASTPIASRTHNRRGQPVTHLSPCWCWILQLSRESHRVCNGTLGTRGTSRNFREKNAAAVAKYDENHIQVLEMVCFSHVVCLDHPLLTQGLRTLVVPAQNTKTRTKGEKKDVPRQPPERNQQGVQCVYPIHKGGGGGSAENASFMIQ